MIDHLPLKFWSREPPAGGLPLPYRTVGMALLEQRSPVAAEPQLWETRSDLRRAGVPRAVCHPRAGTGHAGGPGETRAAPFLPVRCIPSPGCAGSAAARQLRSLGSAGTGPGSALPAQSQSLARRVWMETTWLPVTAVVSTDCCLRRTEG